MKLVFLDRDGVINKPIVYNGKPFAPRKLEEFVFYEGVLEQLQKLKDKGFTLVIVTNQPDVGRGLISQKTVQKMHDIIKKELPIALILACFHRRDEDCTCRKPKSGMLKQATDMLGKHSIHSSYMIGDRWSDIECGKEFGCKTIFIDRNYEMDPKSSSPDFIVSSLEEAVEKITAHQELLQPVVE